jgi:hypothetical protein
MKREERLKVVKKLKEDIKHINEFSCEDDFISAYFQQFMSGMNEYNDNSMELGYQYKKLKEIGLDEEFFNKLHYVLSDYVSDKLKSNIVKDVG